MVNGWLLSQSNDLMDGWLKMIQMCCRIGSAKTVEFYLARMNEDVRRCCVASSCVMLCCVH